jgi:Nuclease-related domain
VPRSWARVAVAKGLRQWASCCHPRHRRQRGSPRPLAGASAQPGGGRPGGRADGLGAAGPTQPRRQSLAAGAVGERRTARLLARLERQGWVVLHDLAVPGSRANLDHLVIGHGGVFVIDSKQYRGRLHLDGSGRLWHDRYPSPRSCGRCRSRPTRPPRSWPTRAWRWCRSWRSMAPRSPEARSSWTVSRSCRPGDCHACCALSRWCWDPSGSPTWPTGPGFASAPPPNLTRGRLLHPARTDLNPTKSLSEQHWRSSVDQPEPSAPALRTAAAGNHTNGGSLALAGHARRGTVAASGKPSTKGAVTTNG